MGSLGLNLADRLRVNKIRIRGFTPSTLLVSQPVKFHNVNLGTGVAIAPTRGVPSSPALAGNRNRLARFGEMSESDCKGE